MKNNDGMCLDGEQGRDCGLEIAPCTAVRSLGPQTAVAASPPDPYITSLRAHLPEGWGLLSWGTEDG